MENDRNIRSHIARRRHTIASVVIERVPNTDVSPPRLSRKLPGHLISPPPPPRQRKKSITLESLLQGWNEENASSTHQELPPPPFACRLGLTKIPRPKRRNTWVGTMQERLVPPPSNRNNNIDDPSEQQELSTASAVEAIKTPLSPLAFATPAVPSNVTLPNQLGIEDTGTSL